MFLDQQVVWLSLEELSRQPNLDPLLNLLTLPVRPESELAASSQQILASRPDLKTEEQIMVIAGIPREEIRQLNRRCGPLTGATTAQIQALPLDQLESLADALLDFQGPADLTAWLAAIS